ncbi:LysM domain protein [Desulfosporosinus acididurans]|uniref:LysM domain protein n=1 Tax=Desulfosporosinus acididurans TaxID=476652 RepID=A0A0J1FU35_9FIRM|nr:LysM domain-containing protein [Desulfosporosinus acididurans]KLU66812.1 LysM domain protein [Desulfosporosinus acididurans]
MYHYVRRGETLHIIAKNYGTHVHRLMALNPQICNPNRIYPGEKIRVR